jgi:hypothetical protein
VRAFVDGPFDGMLRRERSDSQQCHRPVGSATECGGFEDLPCAHTIGNASCRAPKLHDRAGDKSQARVSNVAAWSEWLSKCYLYVFKELPYLWLWKTNDQPSKARQ